MDDATAQRWAALGADMSWAPPLTLPDHGLTPRAVKTIVLTMAEDPAAFAVDSPETTDRIISYLDQIYGIGHPDTLEHLTPAIHATYRAVTGARHDAHHVDPVFQQQLRHTLSLDRRYPLDRPDAVWDIGHEWKPPPPRKPKPHAKKRASTGVNGTRQAAVKAAVVGTRAAAVPSRTTSSASEPVTMARRAIRRKVSRLDRLAANVHAARRRQLARQAPTPFLIEADDDRTETRIGSDGS